MDSVAIVVPCYNSGDYLREAVDSALAQTYRSVSCIVVDDGSTDEATILELERVSALDRVRLIRTDNRGLPSARNAGIVACGSMYFMPLDADDIIAPRYVEEAVRAMQSDPEVGIVYCRARLFGDVNGSWGLEPFTFEKILVDNLIFATALFRRADWVRVGGYDETMIHGREDHDFNLRILALGRTVHCLDGEYFAYRQHGTSLKDVTGTSRETLVTNSARIMRNSIALYQAHAEDLFTYIYHQTDTINDLRHRYSWLETIRQKYPNHLRWLHRVFTTIGRTGGLTASRSIASLHRVAACIRSKSPPRTCRSLPQQSAIGSPRRPPGRPRRF